MTGLALARRPIEAHHFVQRNARDDEDDMGTQAQGGQTVRAVERALAVLQALNRQPVSSVDYLHKTTKLPKPTLVRLLRTMVNAGYLTNDVRQSGYQLTSLVTSLSSGFHGDPLVVQAGHAWAINMTRQLKWPVGIAVFDEDAVVIRFSTVGDSPMSPFHATINMRLSLFSRALGRAYLSYCSEEQLQAIVTRCAQSDDPENRLARDPVALRDLIQRVRAGGYATRDREVEPRNSNTIAMPIMVGGEVRASIGVTYFTAAIRSKAAVQQCIDALRATVIGIEGEIERLQQSAPLVGPLPAIVPQVP
jgi:IclR family mhp operon transcriptional activator